MTNERRSSRGVLAAICLLLAAAVASPAQQPTKPPTIQPPAPGGLVITIDEPHDWSPSAAGIGTRGIIANIRSSIRVSGTAKHPSGIQEVLLNKNRASIAETADGSTQFTGYVRVEERMTSAEVTVVTKTGERLPVQYNITPTEPPPPDPKPDAAWAAKSAASGFKGKRWAVVIGISKYEDKAIPGLKYADADAKAFYDFLRSPLAGMDGFEADKVKILLNEEATYRNMRVALFDFLKSATSEDVVYIYFAGHGSPDPQRLENLYLLPYDAKSTSIGGTSFPMEDMNKALRQVSAAHKILITDACHSGGITAEGTRAGLGINEINNVFLDRMANGAGVNATFTASGPAETSAEGEQWGGGHGVFTHYLLEGLAGAADADGDHIVDLREMINYASSNVERATAGSQHPMTGQQAYDQSFPIALVVPGKTIVPISLEEIAKAQKERSIMDKADETPWLPPDSAVFVQGMPDTIRVRLQTPDKDVIPPTWLTWSSSNSLIATVDKNGLVTPLAGGTVMISAARGGRKVEALLRVLPRPSDVTFSPAQGDTSLVLTESIRVRSDLLVGTSQWYRDMLPRVTVSDTLVLKQQPNLEFVAYREGTVALHASIGGRTKDWNIRVIPPGVKIKPIPVAAPINDSLSLTASRVRPDGSALGDASNVAWQSLDTARAVVRNGKAFMRGIGRARFTGTLGNATDTVSTFVLGDLLVATEGNGAPNILTIAVNGGQSIPLLPKGTEGAEPALSPKGDQIAFVSNKRLHLMDPDGSNVRRLTPDMKGVLGGRISSYEEHTPSWTSDGTRVLFVSNAPGNYEVLSVSADGKDVQRLTNDSEQERNVSTAPDKPRAAYERAIAFDESEIVITLPDGSQAQRLPALQTTSSLRAVSQVKPKFLPGGTEMVIVRRWPGRDGESLHIVKLDSGTVTKDLVREEKDYSLMYAVSPDGQYIAYHRTTDWGKKNGSIAIMDKSGVVIKTINVAAGLEIKSIGWGASPIRPKEGK